MAASLLLHGLILGIPRRDPPGRPPPARLEARLGPRQPGPIAEVPPPAPSRPETARPSPSRRVIAVDKGNAAAAAQTPKWTAAERADMNRFLDELAGQAKAQPSLAQRSLAAARALGSSQGRQESEGSAQIERLPDSPPIDPFSLELYLDALIKKLNRSAAFVRNEPRTKGVRTASVQLRLNPDGSLKSFEILHAADQQGEIARIRSIVERAAPFSAFPADLKRSAGSMAMIICIQPSSADAGFGFTRMAKGQGC